MNAPRTSPRSDTLSRGLSSRRFERGPRRGHGRDDPERSLLIAVRVAMIAAVALPLAIGALGESVMGDGFTASLAAPLLALAAAANLISWRRVIALWRACPRPDDDHGGPGRSDGDAPLEPLDGPGGIAFRWVSFERAFRAYVAEQEHEARTAVARVTAASVARWRP